ncbi:MAG TPA: hypothetical protein VK821_20760, partial [Dehalococcoidia bacterium]|nr:hypothetical protein [Dehalococcoidia bacterium]
QASLRTTFTKHRRRLLQSVALIVISTALWRKRLHPYLFIDFSAGPLGGHHRFGEVTGIRPVLVALGDTVSEVIAVASWAR